MTPIEIVVIIACILIVGSVTLGVIIRKKKGKPSCCSTCSGCPHAKACQQAQERAKQQLNKLENTE